MNRVAARRNGLIKRVARLRVLLLLQAQLAEFLVISSGRIVDNYCFQSPDARPASESLQYPAKELCVRQNLNHDVRAGSQESSKENDVQPIGARAAPHKVHQRDDLHQKAPWIKKLSKSEHRGDNHAVNSICFPPVRIKQNVPP